MTITARGAGTPSARGRSEIAKHGRKTVRAFGGDEGPGSLGPAKEDAAMFQQLLTPIAGSRGLSFIVATLPIVAVLVMLGVLRRPAWQAALSGLIVGLVIAIAGWEMPAGLA